MLGADIDSDLVNGDAPVLLNELVVTEDLLLADLLLLDLVDNLVLGGLDCLGDALELGDELFEGGLELLKLLGLNFELGIEAVGDDLYFFLNSLEVLGPLLGWGNLADLLEEGL